MILDIKGPRQVFAGHAPFPNHLSTWMTEPRIELQNLTRRCNEALILTSLARGAKHGYQLALDLQARGGERFALKHGTLYPILHDLEKRGLIEGAWSDEGPRGKRKSYRLTPLGRSYGRSLREEWGTFMEQLSHLLREEDG
jgi:PadR family transcriptional regulator PadR